jgi:hypothetical protein
MLILSLSLEAKSNKSKALISYFWLQIPAECDRVLHMWGCLIVRPFFEFSAEYPHPPHHRRT